MDKTIDTIRDEVRKLKSLLVRGSCSAQIAMETNCKSEAYNEVLCVLNSIESKMLGPDATDRFYVILYAAQKAVGKQLEPGRNRDDVMIRYIVCRQMVTEGFPTNTIGRLIGRDHSTVVYGSNYIKTALEMPLVYWDVVQSWNRFQDILKELDRNETE